MEPSSKKVILVTANLLEHGGVSTKTAPSGMRVAIVMHENPAHGRHSTGKVMSVRFETISLNASVNEWSY